MHFVLTERLRREGCFTQQAYRIREVTKAWRRGLSTSPLRALQLLRVSCNYHN